MNDKRQKTERLGMPTDTAERKLRKAVIFEFAQQLGKDFCVACGQRIESPADLAIFHIQDWSDNPERYWDLTNVALGHPSCATAFGGRGQESTKMRKIKVTIEDENGNLLPAAMHDGTLFVGGEKNQRYRIRIRNLTRGQLCCVVSVDGRNAISGTEATQDGDGYVVHPHGETVIDGWRRSDQEVAAFRFSSPNDSYSAQSGSPENVGIIGVAVFEHNRINEPKVKIVTVKEYVPMPFPVYPTQPWRPLSPYLGLPVMDSDLVYRSAVTVTTANMSGSGIAPMSDTPSTSVFMASTTGVENVVEDQAIGTGYGEDLRSPSHKTTFHRQANPSEVVEIRYDEVSALIARGILRDGRKHQEPRAFPKARDVSPGFAPAPQRRTVP